MITEVSKQDKKLLMEGLSPYRIGAGGAIRRKAPEYGILENTDAYNRDGIIQEAAAFWRDYSDFRRVSINWREDFKRTSGLWTHVAVATFSKDEDPRLVAVELRSILDAAVLGRMGPFTQEIREWEENRGKTQEKTLRVVFHSQSSLKVKLFCECLNFLRNDDFRRIWEKNAKADQGDGSVEERWGVAFGGGSQ